MKKTILITGAAGGIGQCLVQVLASKGWSVIGTDHPELIPSKLLNSFCHGWVPLDLATLSNNSEELNLFKEAIISNMEDNGLHSIIHNAALQRIGGFEELSLNDWQATLAVNLIAPVVISQLFLPQLKKQHGSIIHIGSIHSTLTKPGFSAYASSKAALAGLSKSMAVELGRSIRVNTIEPAAIATSMLDSSFENRSDLKALLQTYHPTGTIGTPEDVARTVEFLLDPKNAFLNGCTIKLTGGIHNCLHDPS